MATLSRSGSGIKPLSRSNSKFSLSRSGSGNTIPAVGAPYARFCKLIETETTSTNKGSKVTWDDKKIKSTLSNTELEDSLLIKNITQGYIASGKILPLLFNQCLPDSPAHFRSMPFFRKVVSDPSILQTLDEEQQCSFVVGVRDFWLASLWSLLEDKNEQKLLEDLLEVCDDEASPYGEFQFLTFSLSPTRSRRVLRYIEHLDEVVGEDFAKLAAKLNIEGMELYAVWVDGRDLSYHNFECILPLDRALHLSSDMFNLKLHGFKKINEKMNVFVGKVRGKDVALLKKLDELGLYQKPSNSATRGGERFIFSSPTLSESLTAAVWDSGVLDLIFPKVKKTEETEGKKKESEKGLFSFLSLPSKARMEDEPEKKRKKTKMGKEEKEEEEEEKRKRRGKYGFVAVNSVFRCNRFAPGDTKFNLHMDTPYYDPVNKHVSKYTIIIYMTHGEGSPALRIGGGENGSEGEVVNINKLEEMQCVIFDQRYEHEGTAFANNNKIFLRSELIFKADKTEHKPDVGGLFSSAIYYTAQTTHQSEFAQHAHELYEKVNRAHWGLDKKGPKTQPQLLQKCWNDNVYFATNGFDYYFPFAEKDEGDTKKEEAFMLALKSCAMVAVLDYFNCKNPIKSENEKEPAKKKAKKEGKTPKKIDVEESAFRAACETKKMAQPPEDRNVSEWVIDNLWEAVRKNEVNLTEPVMKCCDREEKTELVEEHRPDLLKKKKDTDAKNETEEKAKEEIKAESEEEDEGDKEKEEEKEDDGEASKEGEKKKKEESEEEAEKSSEEEEESSEEEKTTKKKKNEEEKEVEESEEDAEDEEDGDMCCPFHRYKNFVPEKCDDVVDVYEKAYDYTVKQLSNAPLVLLGKEIHLDPKCLLVEDNKIFINATHGESLRVNFAACWNCYNPPCYIGVGEEISVPRFLLPPIPFRIIPAQEGKGRKGRGGKRGAGFHLMLDFFQNDWTVPVADLDRQLPIPCLNDEPADDEESPFLNSINKNLKRPFDYYDDWAIHAHESDTSDSD